jgi:hypothetical protein
VYVGSDAVCMPAPIKQIALPGQPPEKLPCAQTCPTGTNGAQVPQVYGPTGLQG